MESGACADSRQGGEEKGEAADMKMPSERGRDGGEEERRHGDDCDAACMRVPRSVDISVRVVRDDNGHALDARIHNDLARKAGAAQHAERATSEHTRRSHKTSG